MTRIEQLRRAYHQQVCAQVIFRKEKNAPSMADVDNALSRRIAEGLLQQLPYPISPEKVEGQTAGKRLEEITKDFLEQAFAPLQPLRPGPWHFSVHDSITEFEQYQHLGELTVFLKEHKSLKTALGDYVIAPDIVVARTPLSDGDFNQMTALVAPGSVPQHTPLRAQNNPHPILHASISCKWTLRSDRSQNARTEGLNLIRNRKGHTPHIVVVTGEPLPSRIASLALGTGDIDCVYHFALHELQTALLVTGDESASEMLAMMVEGHRLRDIADLPFDLAI